MSVASIYRLSILLCVCVCVVPTGKLGHGDTNRVYKPKVIEALQGMFIRKVCAGSQSSLALTSTGQVSRTSCDSAHKSYWIRNSFTDSLKAFVSQQPQQPEGNCTWVPNASFPGHVQLEPLAK